VCVRRVDHFTGIDDGNVDAHLAGATLAVDERHPEARGMGDPARLIPRKNAAIDEQRGHLEETEKNVRGACNLTVSFCLISRRKRIPGACQEVDQIAHRRAPPPALARI
jgi:hypothetical protein